MVGGLGAALLLGVVVVASYIIVAGLEEIEENNEAIRRALRDIDENYECYVTQRQRHAQLEVRISRQPLELNRFVETAASAVGVSIAESSEVSPVAMDRFTQRGVEIKLRQVTIEQLAKLIKELENSPHVVQITRLNVSTRWNQHKDLDVEMVVSAFERRELRPEPPGEKRRRRPERAPVEEEG